MATQQRSVVVALLARSLADVLKPYLSILPSYPSSLLRIILDAISGHHLGTHASIPLAFWIAGASGVAAQVLLSVSLVAYAPDGGLHSPAAQNLKDRPPADFWMDFWMVVVRDRRQPRPPETPRLLNACFAPCCSMFATGYSQQ